MSKKVARVIIDAMKEAGVEHCYGIVGDTLNAFATNLAPGGIGDVVALAVTPRHPRERTLEFVEIVARRVQPQLLGVQVDALLGQVQPSQRVGGQQFDVDLVHPQRNQLLGPGVGTPGLPRVERRKITTNDAGPVVGAPLRIYSHRPNLLAFAWP